MTSNYLLQLVLEGFEQNSFALDQVDIFLPKREPGGAVSLPGHPHEIPGPLCGGGDDQPK